ncbi:uncharacterized protein LOC123910897 [Trifolium pratense]|uniref:uncharacterized protein LOC123910897 n=1 Tax=Trifolium pratense TaxID=57577 RepID=UPI001E69301B|nr:uncharacterized protein LOC123910897 [Trifolium pratense]
MAPTRASSNTNNSIEQLQDRSSPYYVHPSDGPSSVTVKPLLTGSSYHSWVRSMWCALGGKMKYEFVDGTIPVVTDPFDPTFRAWTRCNMLVLSWIMNSVSESIGNSIVFMKNAIDVLDGSQGTLCTRRFGKDFRTYATDLQSSTRIKVCC